MRGGWRGLARPFSTWRAEIARPAAAEPPRSFSLFS